MKSQLTKVNVHPLVLLSVVDHFNRVNLKTRNRRVIGAILGISLFIKDKLIMESQKYPIVMPFHLKKI
jgi:hypothetical protein